MADDETAEAEWPKGAIAVTSNLDLLVDEPLELAIALRKLAESKAHESVDWRKFAERLHELVTDLQALNEPPDKAV